MSKHEKGLLSVPRTPSAYSAIEKEPPESTTSKTRWIRILLGILLVCLFVATVLVLTELFQKESSESSPFKLHGRAPVFAAKGPKGAKDDNDGYDNGLENVGEVRQCWNFSGTLDPYDCPGGYEIATPTANYSLTCIYIAESSSLSISAVGASSTKGLKGDSSIKGVMAGHHLKQSKKSKRDNNDGSDVLVEDTCFQNCCIPEDAI